jgi:hypothetical protein
MRETDATEIKKHRVPGDQWTDAAEGYPRAYSDYALQERMLCEDGPRPANRMP